MTSKPILLILGHAPIPVEHPDYTKVVRHPGRWVVDQAMAMAKDGDFRVILVTLVKGASQDFEELVEGVRIVYLKAQPKLRERTGYLWDVLRLRNFMRKVRPDVCHAHGTEDAYALALLGSRIPTAVTVQNLYWDLNRQDTTPFFSPSWVIERWEAFVLNCIQSVVVKSRCFGDIVRERFPHLMIEIIPNTPSQLFLEAELQAKNLKKLAFVGSVLRRKGFHLLGDALELLKDVESFELHVYGECSDKVFVDGVVEQIREAGHSVKLHGKVAAQQLLEGLAETHALIAPSCMEPYGNQVIEGLLSGCHCIVSEGTGMAENVRKYGNGTVVPQRDAQAIADALMASVKNAGGVDASNLRKLAKERIYDDTNAKSVSAKLSTYYKSIMI